MDCLPTELLTLIFSFVVNGWTAENLRLLRISRRVQPIVRHILCGESLELRSYKDVDKLLRYFELYPAYAPSVKQLSIRLKDIDIKVSPSKSIDPAARMDNLSLAKLCYLCQNIQTLTFWSPFYFRCDPSRNDPDFEKMFGFRTLRHIQVFNDKPRFLVSLLQKYPHITKLEFFGVDGFQGWIDNCFDMQLPAYSFSAKSGKDTLPNSPLLPIGLTSILMPAGRENHKESITTIQDVIVHDLGLNSPFPTLQVLELALLDHGIDKLLFPLLRRIKHSIKSLRLSGEELRNDQMTTNKSIRQTLCNQFYALLLECDNLQLLCLSGLHLIAWDRGSKGYFPPALRTLILDQVTGTSVNFSLWLSTIISTPPSLSNLEIHFPLEVQFADEELERWDYIFQTHGVTFQWVL
ncbi:hypothetical protein BT69DRAFT_228822 [Atractiella rhizophila]|nr:hypothetical protein BT69DRAFT_228822 [Atractiella rhizophila]